MIPARTLLAAVDFSEASRGSLHCAGRLAARWRAALHVVHVVDPLLATAAQMHHIELLAGTRDDLRTFCRESALDDGVEPILHVLIGHAAETICEAAGTQGADLIVAGSRGLSGLNRMVMGSIVERVIRGARVSVLTVPGRCPADGVNEWGPVIAAIDDPEAPESVTRAAAALASSLGARLHIVHVVPPLAAPARWKQEADAAWQARSDEARRGLTAAIRALPVTPDNVHIA